MYPHSRSVSFDAIKPWDATTALVGENDAAAESGPYWLWPWADADPITKLARLAPGPWADGGGADDGGADDGGADDGGGGGRSFNSHDAQRAHGGGAAGAPERAAWVVTRSNLLQRVGGGGGGGAGAAAAAAVTFNASLAPALRGLDPRSVNHAQAG